jgi:hypothetical protein
MLHAAHNSRAPAKGRTLENGGLRRNEKAAAREGDGFPAAQ